MKIRVKRYYQKMIIAILKVIRDRKINVLFQQHSRNVTIGIVLMTMILVALVKSGNLFSDTGALYIAIVGPMSNEEELNGEAMMRGMSLYLDEINRKGGVNGKQVKLLKFDDQNDPDRAKEIALEIVKENVLVVLGHFRDAPSLAGGAIYKAHGMPAITGASLVNEITEGNEWYFRVSFSNRTQARFLANYVKNILKRNVIRIIHAQNDHETSLAETFQKTFEMLGGEIKNTWRFDEGSEDIDGEVDNIVENLFSNYTESDPEMLFFATSEDISAKIIVAMKKKRLNYPIIGDDWRINTKFANYPEEQEKPGYFSDGIYSAKPFDLDTGDAYIQKLFRKFLERYGQKPGEISVTYYNAALVAVQAMKKAEIQDGQKNLAENRKKIRDYLASVRNINDAIKGITGPIYFDQDGTLNAPINISIFENQQLIPALAQLKAVEDPKSIGIRDLQAGRIFRFNSQYMYKTNVVYSGIEIQKIRDIDLEDFSYTMEFSLWFRYPDGFDVENIEFLNAVTPIQLTTSTEKEASGEEEARGILIEEQTSPGRLFVYRRYDVIGRFKADFLPSVPGKHVLGVMFRHRNLTRDSLVYVIDPYSIILPGALSVPGWTIKSKSFFENINKEQKVGLMADGQFQRRTVEYSQINTGIWIKGKEFPLRSIVFSLQEGIPARFAKSLSVLSCIMIGCLVYLGRRKRPKYFPITFFQVFFIFLLLLSVESMSIHWVNGLAKTSYQNIIILTFDILWFIIPACLVIKALDRIFWEQLEKQTGRNIPHVLRRGVEYIIYITAFFGILFFVLGQKIAGLAATSGILAALLAFASKVDLSNISAGFGISLAQPFRIGDWVKIGDSEEGQVIEMTSRSTNIRTRDHTMLVIPNTTVAASIIENYSHPDPLVRLRFTLTTAPIYRYERVEKILLDAVLSTTCVLHNPKPKIIFHGQGDSCAIFEVVFYIKEYHKKVEYKQKVWRRVWRHLERAGIGLATPRREILMVQSKSEDAIDPVILLQNAEIFQSLPDEAKIALSKRLHRHYFETGEKIIHQDDTDDSLFIIAEGTVSVCIHGKDGKLIEIDRLGAGDFFGETALLTGEPRTASIISVTESFLFEIKKEDLTLFIEKRPEIITKLNKELARRKIHRETQKNLQHAQEVDKKALHTQFFQKVQKFFIRGRTPSTPEDAIDLLIILQDVEILQPLPDEAKMALSKQLHCHYCKIGEHIIHEGDTGDSLFIVVEGTISVYIRGKDGKSIEIDRLGAGDFFGETALLTGEPRTASIISVTESFLFEIKKGDMVSLMEERPEIINYLSKELVRRKIHREAQRNLQYAQETEKNAFLRRFFQKTQPFWGGKKP